nr:hypothetical protein [Acaryochloris sp. IP29b_bin.137]
MPKTTDYFIHEPSYMDEGTEIGFGTKIQHFCHIYSYNKTQIGQHCVLGHFCSPSMVFTNIKTPRCEFPRNTSTDYHKALVKRGASIGANATIVCGITLNEGAFFATGAVVTKDVYGVFPPVS